MARNVERITRRVGGRTYAIARNRWDNWYGYAGSRRVASFGAPAHGTQEQEAREWLAAQGAETPPPQPAAEPLARIHWLRLARRWADLRWCWHEVEDDGHVDLTQRPDLCVDAMAEHWGLEDPTQGWGVRTLDRDAIERLRQRIVSVWIAGGGSD